MLARAVPRRVGRDAFAAAGGRRVIAAVLLMAAGHVARAAAVRVSRVRCAVGGDARADARCILAAVAACFGGLALAVAAGARRWSTAFITAALAAVVLYLVDFLAIGWPPMRAVAWLSPFHYYPALSILTGTAPAWRNLGILMAAAASLVRSATGGSTGGIPQARTLRQD